MRIQKYMAKCGVASRRKSEELITQGKVRVNERVITELGYKIDQKNDVVKVNNKIIKLEEKKVYIILNKPEGYVTTVSDQFNRPTVLDLVQDIEERIFPVGRLDYGTSGLLLLTNDGDLAFKLTHPKHEITKKYIAVIKGIPIHQELEEFRKGLKIDGYTTAKAKISILEKYNDSSKVDIEIHEGRNRQIRKMCDVINHPVLKLTRIGIGNIQLANLEKGKWRYLTEKEINYLKKV